MAPAISVTNLGKMYRLSHQGKRTDSFREAITSSLMSPLRRLRQIRGTDETMEEFWALKDVSFDVQPGEVVGIIGRNGAGKSTLLKILSRIVEPTTGEIRLRGRVASLLEVGTGFHPELTGRENIYLNGSVLGMKKREIDRKFDEIVDFAEVEKFLDTPVKRYSSGMYVRLAFAVAAYLDPEILIVDEVLAVGDAEFQKKCLGKMKEVATGTGRTVLFVSHNMAAIESLCDSAVLLSHGIIEANGMVDAIVEKYCQSTATSLFNHVVPKKPDGASVWIRSATIMSPSSNSDVFRMGDDLLLKVEFGADPPLRDPKLGWVMTDEKGYRILCANNRYQRSDRFEDAVSCGTIECKLGAIPLMPGRYACSIYLGNSSQDTHVIQDAVGFEIIARDLWNEGSVPPIGASAMWWPTNFRISNPNGDDP